MAVYPRFAFNRFDRAPAGAAPSSEAEAEPVDPLDLPVLSRRDLLNAVAEARATAFAEGAEAGERDGAERTLAGLEARTASAMERLVERLDEIEGGRAHALRAMETACAAVVVAAVRRLAPELLERTAGSAVERTVAEAIRVSADSPVLKIRVSPDLLDATRALVERAARSDPRRVEVTPDDALEPGAIEARWEAGSLIRDPAAIRRRIDLVCRRATAALEGEPSAPRPLTQMEET